DFHEASMASDDSSFSVTCARAVQGDVVGSRTTDSSGSQQQKTAKMRSMRSEDPKSSVSPSSQPRRQTELRSPDERFRTLSSTSPPSIPPPIVSPDAVPTTLVGPSPRTVETSDVYKGLLLKQRFYQRRIMISFVVGLAFVALIFVVVVFRVLAAQASAKTLPPTFTTVVSIGETTVILDVNPVVRYPLLFFNMVLSFVGGGTGALGLYAIFETMDEASDDEETLKKNQLQNLTVLRIELVVTVAGVILLFVSCFGCVGALRENIVLLRVYSGFLTLLTLACLVLGIVAFFMPGNVKAVVQDTLSDSLIVHYRDTPDNQHFVDALQRHLRCCGMSDNFRDWNKNM
ncbi:hypothetical protein IscW_ISCW000533, partial [Ixodes scapularis]